MGLSKRKRSSSNGPFSGAKMLVSGSVYNIYLYSWIAVGLFFFFSGAFAVKNFGRLHAYITRWWQLKYFSFSPRTLGKMIPFWRAYFPKGLVKNHQPDHQKTMGNKIPTRLHPSTDSKNELLSPQDSFLIPGRLTMSCFPPLKVRPLKKHPAFFIWRDQEGGFLHVIPLWLLG